MTKNKLKTAEIKLKQGISGYVEKVVRQDKVKTQAKNCPSKNSLKQAP